LSDIRESYYLIITLNLRTKKSLFALESSGSLGSFLNLLSGSSLLCLGLVDLLLILLFLLSVLDFLLGGLDGSVSLLGLLSSLPLDVFKRDTDNSFLDSSGFLGSSLEGFINLDLLVESSPGLGPGELDWLSFSQEQTSNFFSDKEVSFSIPGDEFPSLSGIDPVSLYTSPSPRDS